MHPFLVPSLFTHVTVYYLVWFFPFCLIDAGTERTVENSKGKTESGTESNVLVRAVNNPVFIPRSNNAQSSIVKSNSSLLASAVHAPEFVPGKGFGKYEAMSTDHLKRMEEFVNTKLKQLIEDPGLLDELSMSMANYLSAHITVENEMGKLSDILFQKVGTVILFKVL